MTTILSNSVGWFKRDDRWEKILAFAVFVLAAFLLFYNLDSTHAPGRMKALQRVSPSRSCRRRLCD